MTVFLNELTFTLFNYREAGVMGAESRVAVDREGKHPIVEVPIRTNDGGQQIEKISKVSIEHRMSNDIFLDGQFIATAL